MVEHGVGKKHMGKKLVKLVIFCCCRLKERPESPIFTYVRVFRVFSFFFLVGRFAFEGRQSGLLGRGTVSDDGRRRRRRRSVRKADLGGAGAADGCAPPPSSLYDDQDVVLVVVLVVVSVDVNLSNTSVQFRTRLSLGPFLKAYQRRRQQK